MTAEAITPNAVRRPRPAVGGFSLIEVTIALGITTFALVAVLGVIPSSLTSLRESGGSTVRAQIVRSVASQLNLGTFTGLGTTNYYDMDGSLMTEKNDKTFFEVTATEGGNPPSYPGSSSAPNLSNVIKTVTVRVGGLYDRNTNTYTIHVANTAAN